MLLLCGWAPGRRRQPEPAILQKLGTTRQLAQPTFRTIIIVGVRYDDSKREKNWTKNFPQWRNRRFRWALDLAKFSMKRSGNETAWERRRQLLPSERNGRLFLCYVICFCKGRIISILTIEIWNDTCFASGFCFRSERVPLPKETGSKSETNMEQIQVPEIT